MRSFLDVHNGHEDSHVAFVSQYLMQCLEAAQRKQ